MTKLEAGRRAGLALALLIATAVTPALAKDQVIHAGRLIDGVSTKARENVSILIRDDRIVGIENGFAVPAGAEVIDLRQATVLPGLIDTHVHISFEFTGGNPVAERVTRTAVDDALRATNFARRTLDAGFTSVRDVSGDTATVVGLKRAIANGIIAGPRLWVAGTALGPTGGHSDPRNGLDQELGHPHWADSVIDGPDEAAKAVRRLHREGADLVKIMPSGGVLSIGDDPNHQLMSDAEIKAVVDAAHALGMKVAAHAHGKTAIDNAARLGVDSIEHGSFGDADTYKVMKSHGTYLVPTLLVADTVMQIAKARPDALPPSSAKKALEVGPITISNLNAAYKAGVKIAFGTDQALSPHGQNAKEFALMVKAGMAPIDAIIAATSNAADLLGASADVGSIRPGRYADIIAVSGDPLTDVGALETVTFVMKGGSVVKAPGSPARR